ncbi:MAG: gluconate:H+ symporter [Verrucomicrobiota bacterium]
MTNVFTLASVISPVLAEAGSRLPFLIGLLIAAVALLLVLIILQKMQAFLALLITSAFTALLGGVPITESPGVIEKGMGSNLGFIAVIIGVGAIFGAMLEHSGGAQRLANSLLKIFGEKRASWAMLLTGFILSIPVFLDVGLVIVAPIIYSLTKKSGKSLLKFGLPLVAGMAVTHAFVPPTPGPAYVAYVLGVDMGTMIMVGVAVGLPTAIVASMVAGKMADKLYIGVPEALDNTPDRDESKLPSFGLVLLITMLPIALILLGTAIERFVLSRAIPDGLAMGDYNAALAEQIAAASMPMQVCVFLGKPIVALIIGTLAATLFLGTMRGVGRDKLLEIATKALGPAGIIILITGAGGVFKTVLKQTGIADALASAFPESMPLVVIAFLLTLVIRIAQGSATVAMVTAAALIGTLAADGGYSAIQMALVVVAIAAGATAVSHVNDSGFWIISRYFGMSVKDTLKSWSVVSTVIGLVGFGLALIGSFIF